METTDIAAKLARYDKADAAADAAVKAELAAFSALHTFRTDNAGTHASVYDWETHGQLEQDYEDAQLATAAADAEFSAAETELYPPETMKAWEDDFDAYLREQGRID